jgi:hypothetical protein
MLDKAQNFAMFFVNTSSSLQRTEAVKQPSGIIAVGRVTASPAESDSAANNAHFAQTNKAAQTKARPMPHMHPM